MKTNIFFNKTVFLSLLSLALLTVPLCSFDNEELTANASFAIEGNLYPLTKSTDAGRSFISFFKDDAQQHYLLKVNPNSEAAIHETLASHIASSVLIPVNKVKIIPAHTQLFNNDSIATLHTVVPGKEVATFDGMNYEVFIVGGLTRNSFSSLKKHPQLIGILALDIFVDNYDRHNFNLFFDEATGTFYAIDLDIAFSKALITKKTINEILAYSHGQPTWYNKASVLAEEVQRLYSNNLAEQAYIFIASLNKEELSTEDYGVLTKLRDALQLLRTHYKPRNVYALWMHYAQQAEYTYCIQKKAYIASLIAYNHYRVFQLIKLLDKLIE